MSGLLAYSPTRLSGWVLADYGGKYWVLSLEWNSECVMEGESGEQVEDELKSVTSSSAEWFIITYAATKMFQKLITV